jgi:hypothetical protein
MLQLQFHIYLPRFCSSKHWVGSYYQNALPFAVSYAYTVMDIIPELTSTEILVNVKYKYSNSIDFTHVRILELSI